MTSPKCLSCRFNNNATPFILLLPLLSLGVTLFPLACGQLDPNYYASSCPRLATIVRNGIKTAVRKEPRMAASLLRLHFHDCIVNGCEASALLDDTEEITGEKTAVPNNNSARGYEVIDSIKAEVEKACPLTVSCADILALAAKESVVLAQAGGCSWTVALGRRDGLTASKDDAFRQIPAPFDSFEDNAARFTSKGLDLKDFVVLSGAHTIGLAQCRAFKPRLYNFSGTGKPDPTLDFRTLTRLQALCPDQTSSNTNLVALDPSSPTTFDNCYYSNLVRHTGLLQSDQSLMGSPLTSSTVRSYSVNQHLFFRDFAASMVKLGNLGVLTGEDGQIRRNCRSVNSD